MSADPMLSIFCIIWQAQPLSSISIFCMVDEFSVTPLTRREFSLLQNSINHLNTVAQDGASYAHAKYIENILLDRRI